MYCHDNCGCQNSAPQATLDAEVGTGLRTSLRGSRSRRTGIELRVRRSWPSEGHDPAAARGQHDEPTGCEQRHRRGRLPPGAIGRSAATFPGGLQRPRRDRTIRGAGHVDRRAADSGRSDHASHVHQRHGRGGRPVVRLDGRPSHGHRRLDSHVRRPRAAHVRGERGPAHRVRLRSAGPPRGQRRWGQGFEFRSQGSGIGGMASSFGQRFPSATGSRVTSS